jgi:hypothetical protein
MRLHRESDFTDSMAELGHPLVQKIYPVDAHAMWTDANANIAQQKIIRRHLSHAFGFHLCIADTAFVQSIVQNVVEPTFGTYEYISAARAEKNEHGEVFRYWMRNP